jgi:Xaa-Pro dipeptidase
VKENTPDGVFYDITWVGSVRRSHPHGNGKSSQLSKTLATSASQPYVPLFLRDGRSLGWEVDRIVRAFITARGYGEYFIHRTGHSIGSSIHANGANLDDLEIRDEREIIPNICFSVELRIYMPEFGVRSEVKVLVRGYS